MNINFEDLEVGILERLKVLRDGVGAEKYLKSIGYEKSATYISEVESGKKRIGLEFLIRIAFFHNVSIDYLITGRDKHFGDVAENQSFLGMNYILQNDNSKKIMKNLTNCISSLHNLDMIATTNIGELEEEANQLYEETILEMN